MVINIQNSLLPNNFYWSFLLSRLLFFFVCYSCLVEIPCDEELLCTFSQLHTQPYYVGGLKPAVVGVFTTWKVANTWSRTPPSPPPESWLLNICQHSAGHNLLGEAASIHWAGGVALPRGGSSCKLLAANPHSSRGLGKGDLDRAPTISSILQQVIWCFIYVLTCGIFSFVCVSSHGQERTRKQKSEALGSGLGFAITSLCDLGRDIWYLCFLTHERGNQAISQEVSSSAQPRITWSS